MRAPNWITALLAATVMVQVAGCEHTGRDRVLGIEADGIVAGLVYFDADGSLESEDDDPPLAGVRLRLLPAGTPDTLLRAASGSDGVFAFFPVPVGRYTLVVDPGSVPDTLQVVRVDTSEVQVSVDDTTIVNVAIGFPAASISQARGLPAGERVFVSGVALNSLDAFGDLSLHIADTLAAIRAVGVAPTAAVNAGELVRLRGRVTMLDGQPVLEDVTPFVLSTVGVPPATALTTAAAASASTGSLDANLARVTDAGVTDTMTSAGGDFVLSVDDGSGNLDVVLDADIGFDLSPLVPTATIDTDGLLIPDGNGSWTLKPRNESDLVVQ